VRHFGQRPLAQRVELRCSNPGYNAGMTRAADLKPADIRPDWLAEFEAAARRPLEQRFRYAFIKTYKPVLDDAPFRAFDTMEQYRQWCDANLPDWLGYGRV
jgi:hypothetical protein